MFPATMGWNCPSGLACNEADIVLIRSGRIPPLRWRRTSHRDITDFASAQAQDNGDGYNQPRPELEKETSMVRSVLLAALFLSATPAAIAAEPVGIPACDEFLTKYEACLADKVPSAQQSMLKGQIEQMRTNWTALAKNPQTKPTLDSACKTSADQMKAAVASYGCKF